MPKPTYDEAIPVVVVVMLADERTRVSKDLAAVITCTLDETTQFYNLGKSRIKVDAEFYCGEGICKKLTAVKSLRFQPLSDRALQQMRSEFEGLYRQDEITSIVRQLIGRQYAKHKLIVITDLEITPPGNLRYILWDFVDKDVVISMAAMNPEYWGLREKNPLIILKHRLRASCIRIVAFFLDLERCGDVKCYLFRLIDSAETLDSMVYLGDKHNLKDLEFQGYSLSTDPTKVQDIKTFSSRTRWFEK